MIFIGIILVPIIIIQSIMPYLTRKTISFGVSIEEKYFNQPELMRMRKSYAVLNASVDALCIAITFFIQLNLNDQ
ncbi:hypothetical protein M5W68_15985 [Paenibacillus larvae]|uniref:hypothetical protein n=1 Tax=Paenibacillus larvae TaxID=1464 RepID=UPI0022813DB0|nr:hypothetical protein [Paenibacillus larvae]MCY9509664.1 hypothetical protein [Paenibacillus larvae]MCY9526573.1 hypothetical protein [Paenibacillus larvae]